MNALVACCHFSIFIGPFLYQSAKPPQGTVLLINTLGKGLFQGLVWEMAAPSDGFLLTLVTTMLAPMSSDAHNLDACSFLRSTGRTLFTFFHSRGFYDVPRVLIADARSFQALAAILDHVTN